MTPEEAKANIGKPFKWLGGGAFWWDIITNVNEEGWIIGKFFDSPAEDCRLKQEQPEALKEHIKKKSNNYENKTDRFQDDQGV